jgi:outer membrane protein
MASPLLDARLAMKARTATNLALLTVAMGSSGVSHAQSSKADGAGAQGSELVLSGPAPTRTMSLREAVAFAREHQPSLLTALARVRAAQEDTRIARAQWLPSLGVTAQVFEATANNSTASYLGVRGVDLPRIGGTRVVDHPGWDPQASTLAAVGLDQEVFDFGRIGAQAAVADAALYAERFTADAERLRIDLVVRESFFAVLGAKSILRAADGAYSRAKVHSDQAAAGVKSGLHAPIELTRAQADLARFDVARVQAVGGVRSAQAALAAAIGAVDLVDATSEDGAIAPLPPLSEALRSVETRDPTVRAAAAQLGAQRALTRAVAAESRPDLFVSGGLSGRAGGATPSSGPEARGDGWVPEVPNWHAGLVLRWPLFDPVVRARARSAGVREEVAAQSLASVRQQQAAAVQRAYVQFEVAKASLVALTRAAEAARANYGQAEARFKGGLGTSIEIADAESVRTSAEIQLAVGQFELSRIRAVIARLLAEES